jgi:hypothetical protein
MVKLIWSIRCRHGVAAKRVTARRSGSFTKSRNYGNGVIAWLGSCRAMHANNTSYISLYSKHWIERYDYT